MGILKPVLFTHAKHIAHPLAVRKVIGSNLGLALKTLKMAPIAAMSGANMNN